MQSKLPIDKLSFSAMRSYMTSPAAFWRNYVLKQWDNFEKVSYLEGKALHRALETYYLGEGNELRNGLELFTEGAKDLEPNAYGKKGSLEKSLENITLAWDNVLKAIDAGLIPNRKRLKIINVENPLMHKTPGHEVPLKATPDLVYAKGKKLYGRDWKKVSTLSGVDEETGKVIVDPKYYMQAYFVGAVCEKEYEDALAEFTFTEIRATKKTDTVGVQNVTIKMGADWRKQPEFMAVKHLINEMIEDIKYPRRYIPNVVDMMSGKDEWGLLLREYNHEGKAGGEEDKGASS